MCEKPQPDQKGPVTISHLLMRMALVAPVAAVFAEVGAAGGGVLRYIFGLPLALVLGGLVVVLEWHSNAFFWPRSQAYSERAQTVVAIGLFGLQIMWIVLAGICGGRLPT